MPDILLKGDNMTRKWEMKLFTIYAYGWKLFFHIMALYSGFKHSLCVGLIMLIGIVLHNILSVVVLRGKTIKSKIVDK